MNQVISIIYHHIQGFSRYSVDGEWHVPHFEKMLYDQAQIIQAYADAYVVTKDSFYSDIVDDIATYVARDLRHKVLSLHILFFRLIFREVIATRIGECKYLYHVLSRKVAFIVQRTPIHSQNHKPQRNGKAHFMFGPTRKLRLF